MGALEECEWLGRDIGSAAAWEYCDDRFCDGVGGESVDELKVDAYVLLEPVDEREERWRYLSEFAFDRSAL